MFNVPKIFELEQGGDTRYIIFDNHRPFHLANRHSQYNVVLFGDKSEIEEDDGVIPSDESDVSESEKETSDEEDDKDDDDEDEEVKILLWLKLKFSKLTSSFTEYFLFSFLFFFQI